jgi:hypothetical protein
MIVQTAAEVGIGHLYHYQPFRSDRLRQTLVDGLIYMSRPSDFNDPWDCRPWFNDEAVDDPAFAQRQAEQFIYSHQKWTSPDEKHPDIHSQVQEDNEFLRQKIRDFSVGLWPEISDRYRVYCTSTKADCALMWAHYGDKHRGICIEFGADPWVWANTLCVVYSDTYPSLEVAHSHSLDDLLPLVSKSEYRIVAQERSRATPHKTLLTDNGLLAMPSEMPLSVILGCSMPKEDEAEVCKVIQNSPRTITLKRAIRVANRYALAIVPA